MRTRSRTLPVPLARPLSGALLLLALQGLAVPGAPAAAADLGFTGGYSAGGSGSGDGGWGIGLRQPFGADDGWAGDGLVLAQNDADRSRSGAGGTDTVVVRDGRAGREPDPGQPPSVDLLADVGGVLTPRGTLVVEPQLEYTYDTANRFFFNGIEIVDALLIGIIEVNKAQRETLTASLAGRYGITSRLEADVRVPFVVRRDRLTRQEVGEAEEGTDTLKMNGLGDIDFGLHYQLNRGNGGWPFFVANLRAQSDTGKGPYDVDPEDEAPTGSGFWGVEPSLTVIYPSDPAVLFANVGYVYNFASNVDKTFTSGTTSTRVEEVDPGDSVRASFGIGFALNDSLSLSLAYEHNWIAGTEQEQVDLGTGERTTTSTDDFQAGSLLFGLSHGISEDIGVNVSVAVGVTDDAPDARITVRVPIAFDLFG
ncbi:MAG: hypothetical protein U0S49_02135 [Rhodospirillales bacterium]|nr:hypothetical protein [Rhodospirillales bacterium]